VIQVDLVLLAETLRTQGCEACHEILAGPHGYQEGLDLDEDFFPLWELTLPENQEALEKLDFAAIKARRGPSWSVRPPELGAS
jgi:hypothetical protein